MCSEDEQVWKVLISNLKGNYILIQLPLRHINVCYVNITNVKTIYIL